MTERGRWDGFNRFFEWFAVFCLMSILASCAELVSPLPPIVTLLVAGIFSFVAVEKGYGVPVVAGLFLFTFSWLFALKYNENTGLVIWWLGITTWLAAVLASYNAHKWIADLFRAKYKPAGEF